MVARTRVFLADDHAVVREGLKALVNSQHDMEVMGEAADGREAQAKLRECGADVAVIDLSMPEMNGTQLTEWISHECPGIRVIALTVHAERGFLHRLVQAGASGYVLKRAAAEELIDAIRKVAVGGVYFDPTLAGAAVQQMREQAIRPTEQKPLTHREVEVARLIAQGYSNKEVAAQLHISIKTVETHKARVMEKLGFQSRVELVQYAMDEGWLQVA